MKRWTKFWGSLIGTSTLLVSTIIFAFVAQQNTYLGAQLNQNTTTLSKSNETFENPLLSFNTNDSIEFLESYEPDGLYAFSLSDENLIESYNSGWIDLWESVTENDYIKIEDHWGGWSDNEITFYLEKNGTQDSFYTWNLGDGSDLDNAGGWITSSWFDVSKTDWAIGLHDGPYSPGEIDQIGLTFDSYLNSIDDPIFVNQINTTAVEFSAENRVAENIIPGAEEIQNLSVQARVYLDPISASIAGQRDLRLTELQIGFRYDYNFEYRDIESYDYSDHLSNLFTVLKNSTQKKDFDRYGNEIYWNDSSNPPELHIGLNNELIKAINTFHEKPSLYTIVDSNDNLTTSQKQALKLAIDDYKIDSENINSIIEDSLLTSEFSSFVNSLPVLDYGIYSDTVLEYFFLPSTLENIKRYLDRSDISFTYRANGVEETVDVSYNDLDDFSVDVVGSAESLISEIEIIGFNFDPILPVGSTLESLSGIVPKVVEDYDSKYFIGYDQSTSIYSVYLQDQPINVLNGTYYIDLDNVDTIYDDEFYPVSLVGNTFQRASDAEPIYNSIFYDLNGDGRTTIPFIYDSSDVNNSKSNYDSDYITTGNIRFEGYPPSELTLSEFISNYNLANSTNISYSVDNVIPVLNKNLHLVINPYTAFTIESNGDFVYTTTSYNIESVVRTINSSERTILQTWDDDLSDRVERAFGIFRNGNLAPIGEVEDGFNEIEVYTLENSEPETLKFYVDTANPVPLVMNNESPDVRRLGNNLYFADTVDGQTNYYDFYTSISDVTISFEDYGIMDATIGFADTTGNWYEQSLDITTSQLFTSQATRITVDYQGLFYFDFTDIAGNSTRFFLWYQLPNEDGNDDLISYAELNSDGLSNLVSVGSFDNENVYWVNSDGEGDSKLEINNVIIDNFSEEYWDFENKEWTNVTSGLGSVLEPNDDENLTLAGNIITPFIDDVLFETTKNPTGAPNGINYRKYEVSIGSGLRRYTTSTDIYIKDDATGEFSQIERSFYTYLDNSYTEIEIIDSQPFNYTFEITSYSSTNSINSDGVHILNEDDIVRTASSDAAVDEYNYLGLGSAINFIEGFYKNLSVEYSKLWYEWYSTDTTAVVDNQVIFNREGRYKVRYSDLNDNEMLINVIVFNYPRDFSKYLGSYVDSNGESNLIWLYDNSPVASVQSYSLYEIRGEYRGNSVPDWGTSVSFNLLEPNLWSFNGTISTTTSDVLEPNLPLDTDITLLYESAIPNSTLDQTSFLSGDYINLYERAYIETGNRYDSLLVDHDNNSETPNAPLLEDYDHFIYSYGEFLANGGTISEYWGYKSDPNWDDYRDQPNPNDNSTNPNDDNPNDPIDNNTITPGTIAGITAGAVLLVIISILVIVFLIQRRKALGFKNLK